MSTRAMVHFTHGKEVAARVYRHCDGYPEGLGEDLKKFLSDVEEQTKDTRFDDPAYLAAKFVVWQASQYAGDNPLDFLSVGVTVEDMGGIEYTYILDCSDLDEDGRPTITVRPEAQ